MLQKLKILGLCTVVMLVMGVIQASVAAAEIRFMPGEVESPEVEAREDPTFTIGPRTITCEFLELSGQLPAPSSTMTVAPEFINCTWGTFPVTTTMNGCHYLIHATDHVAADVYTGSVDFVCPEGKKGEMHTYTSTSNHTSGIPACTLTFPPASGYKTITIHGNTNPGVDDISISGTIEGINYETHGPALLCGSNTLPKADGIWHLENHQTGEPITMTGSSEGEPADLRITTVGTD